MNRQLLEDLASYFIAENPCKLLYGFDCRLKAFERKLTISSNDEYVIVDTESEFNLRRPHFVEVLIDLSASPVDIELCEYYIMNILNGYLPFRCHKYSKETLHHVIQLISRPSKYGVKLTIRPLSKIERPFDAYGIIVIGLI